MNTQLQSVDSDDCLTHRVSTSLDSEVLHGSMTKTIVLQSADRRDSREKAVFLWPQVVQVSRRTRVFLDSLTMLLLVFGYQRIEALLP